MESEANTQTTTLDYIDNVTVSGNVFASPANEYCALLSLRQGLDFLANQASKCDELARQKLNPGTELQVLSSGNDPALIGVPIGLLTCAFHWYAVTACQYVRLIGAIAHRSDTTRPTAIKYMEKVIPEVRVFRDKIAAHFSWTTKHPEDSDAERAMSIMPPVSFYNDSFIVGAWTLQMTKNGKESDSSSIKPWSITEVHARLRQRYWR